MPHNIGHMFYVGQEPWHGLGTSLPQAVPLAEALVAAGLDYEVSMRPLALRDELDSDVPQRKAVVREDRQPGEPGRVLGVVHPDFKLLQNRDAGELMDRILGGGRYTTGGYLKNGEVVWLQATLPHPMQVGKADVLQTQLLLSNSHDGSYPIDLRITAVRVVCNNTLNMALRDRRAQGVFRHAHRGSVASIQCAAEQAFEAIRAEIQERNEEFSQLASVACDRAAFDRFIDRLLPVPLAPSNDESSVQKAYETRRRKAIEGREQLKSVHFDGFEAPSTPDGHQPAADSTWWGALNSVTAWVDHVQAVGGNRAAHIRFGGGDLFKSKALELVREMASA